MTEAPSASAILYVLVVAVLVYGYVVNLIRTFYNLTRFLGGRGEGFSLVFRAFGATFFPLGSVMGLFWRTRW